MGEEGLQPGLTVPPPNPPAAKFASQGDVHVRTDAQIKFLYYQLTVHFLKKHPDFEDLKTNRGYEIQTLIFFHMPLHISELNII